MILLRRALAAIPIALAAAAGCGPLAAAPAPDLILLSLDTTRADYLGCYGHRGGLTPALDQLAAEATVYERAYSPSSWTLPAHASLFTGKLPTSHGASLDPKGPISLASALQDRHWSHYRAWGLSEDEQTLAERLQSHGFETAAIVAGPWLKRIFGLAQGFAHYDDNGIQAINGRPAAEVTDAALAWLETHHDRPLFLFLNYYDPHFPFAPPPEFMPAPPASPPADDAARHAWLRELYAAELRYLDAQLARLFAGLRELGRYDGALIAVTADHGELLGEQGRFGHGKTLSEAEIRVPLLIKVPLGRGPAPGRSQAPVSLTDLLPTLLHELGVAPPTDIQGELLPAPAHPIVAEVDPLPSQSRDGAWRALVRADWKYAASEHGAERLFDLRADTAEERDLTRDEPQRAAALRAALDAYLASLPPPPRGGPERQLDPETQRALEALGYLED